MTIIKEHTYLTQVSTYRVQPSQQKELIYILKTAAEEILRNIPGFISANIHRSLDGRSVINYSQWRGQDYFESMKMNPIVKEQMLKAQKLAEGLESILCDVESTHQADLIDPPAAPGFLDHYENNSPI